MFLLGEDILKNLKMAIKGTGITESIVNAEISKFNGIADGIYRSVFDETNHNWAQLLSAFLIKAVLDWQTTSNEKFNDLDEFMISNIQCEYFDSSCKNNSAIKVMKEHVDDRLALFRIASVHSTAYRGCTNGINYKLKRSTRIKWTMILNFIFRDAFWHFIYQWLQFFYQDQGDHWSGFTAPSRAPLMPPSYKIF